MVCVDIQLLVLGGRHYCGYPAVLIRLEQIERDELAERIENAWLTRVPKRLASEFLSKQ